MRYLSIMTLTFAIFITIDGFGQKMKSRNLEQTEKSQKTTTITGAFGEEIKVANETVKSGTVSKRHFDIQGEKSENENIADIDLMEMITDESYNKSDNESVLIGMSLFHNAKEVTDETGFYIQLLESDEILSKEHRIYKEFGNLRVRWNKEGNYVYLIGNFLTKTTSEAFLQKMIIPEYSEAMLVRLEEGKILNDIE